MQLLPIPNTKLCLAAGLQWQVLDPFEAKLFSHNQVQALFENGAKYFVKYKNAKDINYGVTFESDLEQYSSLNIISIAAKVACDKQFKASTSFVVVKNDKTDEENCFVIGLLFGNTIIDQLVAADEVDALLQEFQTLCERSRSDVTTWGDVTTTGFNPDNALTLDEVLNKSFGKSIALSELKNNRTTNIVLMIAGLAAVLFGLWTAYDWYQADEKLLKEQQRASQNTPENMYRHSVERLLREPTLIAPDVWDDYKAQLGAFPTQMGGWTLHKISCKLAICEALWKTQDSTYEDFKAAAQSHPEWGPISTNNNEKDVLGDLKTIRHQVTLKLTLQKLPPQGQWPDAKEFAQTIGVQWQKLKPTGWDATLTPLEQQGIPAGMSSAGMSNLPNAIYAMRWEAKNQRWEQSKEVIATFGKNMTITHLEVTLEHKDKRVIISGGGLVYARK